ncbi:hypothetical protein K7432_012962 [Basidiobolus ranarum]|uniref:Uncharacterized protein n=1 Tax=Basidiobolus ranarum TaxID=34480 RepID=A0ABR2VRI1_9FUNG
MSILKDNLTTKEEEDTYTAFHELENNDQYMIQRRLPMRPNICVICLTCLTCSGKYGSELCTCSPTEIHWNIKKEGYRVDFRRKSVSSSNENFLTWLRANRSARLMWSERYKEVKICMGCNSACWRWMKMYKGSNQTIQNSPSDMARVGSRLSTPFSSRPGIVEDEKPIIQPACVSRPESLPTSPKSPQRIHTDVKNELPVLHTQIPTTFTSPKSPLSAILNLTDSPESTRVPSPTQRAVVNSPRSSELNHEIVAKKSRRCFQLISRRKRRMKKHP